jgi:hypothetical protein
MMMYNAKEDVYSWGLILGGVGVVSVYVCDEAQNQIYRTICICLCVNLEALRR